MQKNVHVQESDEGNAYPKLMVDSFGSLIKPESILLSLALQEESKLLGD